MKIDSDVLIIGSGFGGCLTAISLRKLGYRVCVVDKATHPRFAIGESSTPLADRTLKRLAARLELDWLAPLSAYGTAQSLAPEVTVGLKRGFSYFHHTSGTAFQPCPNHASELMVAASTSDSISDTHWLRSTVDQYIARHLANAAVRLVEGFSIERIVKGSDRWLVQGTHQRESGRDDVGSPLELTSPFIIDASGAGAVLADVTHQRDMSGELKTNTGAIFGHFHNVKDWNDVYVECGGEDHAHPYVCHHAAVHHLIEEGWVWQLKFDNGVTSCGIVFDRTPADGGKISEEDAESSWRRILQKYPSLETQFATAQLVTPSRLAAKERLQHLREPASGEGWLALPSAVGFVDPLHSTGIAHTLAAVEQIAEMFSHYRGRVEFPTRESLLDYGTQLRAEILWIDELVSMCYSAMFDFSLFATATMTYFVVVTMAESDESDGFLSVRNRELVECVGEVSARVRELRRRHDLGGVSDDEIRTAIAWIRERVEPFNRVGLMDPAKQNLYRHTAPSDKTV
ncbi:NAD(P)/FAD-dependent oxidoreductase [Rhodopirellula sp. SWK7]|uniref:NAD(P)/FAD-dependent oxidoreductase n=1 Tax=Rhodopirellula sp. SWK7 TaxID=595460 RepID=UPI0002BE0CB4|nr:tryptophan 7-halogenase [Rhodopirellula sp. SWK7]EMI47014.1 FAD dependent oxidoreductase [Rhodopirellula sp. SWK7]